MHSGCTSDGVAAQGRMFWRAEASLASCDPGGCHSWPGLLCGVQMEEDHARCLDHILKLTHRGMSESEFIRLTESLAKVRPPIADAFSGDGAQGFCSVGQALECLTACSEPVCFMLAM